MTQDKLAGTLGVGRSYLSRVIGAFKERSILETRRSRLFIADLPALEAMSCRCNSLGHFDILLAGAYPSMARRGRIKARRHALTGPNNNQNPKLHPAKQAMEYEGEWRLTERLHAPTGKGDPFAAAVRATRMPMLITDPRQSDNPIVFANDAFLALTGYSRAEVIGRNCRFLQGPGTNPAAVASLRAAVEGGRDIRVELLNYRKDRTPFWNALYVSPVSDEEGNLLFFFASQVDLSAHKETARAIGEERNRVESLFTERTEALQASLKRQEELLHKLDHRVKNNLQLIVTLIALERRKAKDKEAAAALDALRGRIEAVGIAYRRLYDRSNELGFDLGAFIRDVVAEGLSKQRRDGFEIALDLDEIRIATDWAAPLALLIYEMMRTTARDKPLTGSVTVRITLKRANNGYCYLVIDDPRPITDEADAVFSRSADFIQMIARRLQAEVKSEPNGTGIRLAARLPIDQVRGVA